MAEDQSQEEGDEDYEMSDEQGELPPQDDYHAEHDDQEEQEPQSQAEMERENLVEDLYDAADSDEANQKEEEGGH